MLWFVGQPFVFYLVLMLNYCCVRKVERWLVVGESCVVLCCAFGGPVPSPLFIGARARFISVVDVLQELSWVGLKGQNVRFLCSIADDAQRQEWCEES